MRGIITTINAKEKYDWTIPRTSPIELNLEDLQLKTEYINISIIPSIITLNINVKNMPLLSIS